MGAWGTGNFENDTAADWAYALEESDDLALIARTIEAVFEDAFVDADVACEAIAAIETIARLQGNVGHSDSYTETMDNWVRAHGHLAVPADLIRQSQAALERILGQDSELAGLWAETEEGDDWERNIADLKQRIAA